jgi:protein tyrosine phosphatase
MGYSYVNQEIPLMPSTYDSLIGKLYRGTMPWGLHDEDSQKKYLSLLNSNSINKVILLVTDTELDFASEGKSPDALEFYKNHRIDPIHFPMNDGGIPQDTAAFNTLLDTLVTTLNNGNNVLIHCMGGVGRTGLVISCLVKRILERELSLKPGKSKSNKEINESISNAALEHVRRKIPKALETDAQVKFLKTYITPLKTNYLCRDNSNTCPRGS